MDPSLQNGPLQNGRLRQGLQELSRHLLYLRVPLLLAAVAGVVFLTQQVRDVLLAMALEPEWGAFGMAAGSDRDTPAPISLENSFYAGQPGPFLDLNTTEVASGRHFLLAPFRFRSDATFHEPSRSPEERNRWQDVRFSTAAGMSARFPLISPYAFFDGTEAQRQRRTVDGGYYDNSGAVTASEIISGLNRVLAEKGLADRAEVIPIAIVNRSSFLRVPATDRQETAAPVQAGSPGPLLSFSALDALFATRDARLSKTLSDYGVRCGQRDDDGLCITLGPNYRIADVPEAAARVRSIPLGWTLSCQARAFISSQLDPDLASARRSAAGGERASQPEGAADLPCLRRQEQPLRLEAADPSLNFPSFAAIVERLRERNGAAAGAATPSDKLTRPPQPKSESLQGFNLQQ